MLPFDESRRLTGPNLYFDSTGAVLEVVGIEVDARLLEGWKSRVERALRHLGWARDGEQARACVHTRGASLAIAAAFDQLFTATEVNEWALCATLIEHDPASAPRLEEELRTVAAENSPPTPIEPVLEENAAMERFARLAALESRPALRTVVDAAEARGILHMIDDTMLTLGSGTASRSWTLDDVPGVDQVPWQYLRNIPVAAVTGSNGKTTTVRLVAACASTHGLVSGHSCTDGLVIGDVGEAAGDYSGPVGARTMLRDPRIDAAVLETARGGILRRGLAFDRADAAVVTNVSSDHFGEYGIHDLDALADAKLTVAGLIHDGGLLVLNAEDPLLLRKSATLVERFGRRIPLGWFALDADHAVLRSHRAGGGATCGVRAGRLVLHDGQGEEDLGSIDAMPLTVAGAAHYNVANLAAAALAASAMGIPSGAIRATFQSFGTRVSDNPGRLMRFEKAGVQVLVDYAHNPESLRGVLEVARQLRGQGRIGMLLGHAGNRQVEDFQRVAAVVAEFRPDLVVVKENEAHLRGRAAGEVPRIIRSELLLRGFPESSVPLRMTEMEAVRCALDWSQPGDVLVLLVHSLGTRDAVVRLLTDQAAPSGTQ